MEVLIELFQFLRARKKLWMLPIVGAMLAAGGVLALSQTSALAPFLYALF